MSAKAENQKTVQALTPLQWVRLILTYLFIPLVLFVCGWDFGWWQAWVFSVLIVAVGIVGRLWAERLHPGLLAERQNFEKAPGCESVG